MQVTGLETVEGYVERLRQEPGEVAALFRDLLINVTNFFRDADAFEALARMVIPKLFEGRGAEDTVRVWVPGCATGEEVYSIAILMREHMETLRNTPRVQIFATDIDEHSLSAARAGRYPPAFAGQRHAGTPQALLHGRRRRLRSRQDGARPVHLLAAQRHPRPAVLPYGPRLLPQPADLLRSGGPGAGDPHLPLLAEAQRLPVPRHLGERLAALRPVRARG